MRLFFIISLIILGSGCATHRAKTLWLMAGSGLVAGTVGALVAPQGESRLMHGALWAGGASALSGGVGLFVFNEQAKRMEAEDRATQLEGELSRLKAATAPVLQAQGSATLEKPLPSQFRHLVRPGEWRVYSIDQWSDAGDNRVVHQDKILEVIPPVLAPGTVPSSPNQEMKQ